MFSHSKEFILDIRYKESCIEIDILGIRESFSGNKNFFLKHEINTCIERRYLMKQGISFA